MLRAQRLLANGQRTAVQRLGSVVVALVLQQSGEIVEACAGRGMLGAEGLFKNGQRTAV